MIRHSYGRVGYWSVPTTISPAGSDCHLARIVITPQDYVHVAWTEGTTLRCCRKGTRANGWFPGEAIAGTPEGVEDVALATAADGRLHAVWAGRMAPGPREVFHRERASALQHRVVLPLLTGRRGRMRRSV